MHETSDAASHLVALKRGLVYLIDNRATLLRRLPVGAVVAAVVIPVVGCDTGPSFWFHKRASACPRPQAAQGVSGQFNQQQQEIRALRQGGFRGDFFAQLELARRYEGQRAVDKNLEDSVEAAVWYGMALANAGGYSPIAAYERRGGKDKGPLSRFDDCRAFERRAAYGALDRLLSRMSTEEREKVRNRVIYILSTQGADGFRTLARMHDGYLRPVRRAVRQPAGHRGLRSPKRTGAPAALDLFRRNDVDAYLYNYLAVQTGDVSAYVMLKDFERSRRSGRRTARSSRPRPSAGSRPTSSIRPNRPTAACRIPTRAIRRATPRGGPGAVQRAALRAHVAEALAYLRVIPSPLFDEKMLSVNDAQTFQAMLGRPITGRLSRVEKVRADPVRGGQRLVQGPTGAGGDVLRRRRRAARLRPGLSLVRGSRAPGVGRGQVRHVDLLLAGPAGRGRPGSGQGRGLSARRGPGRLQAVGLAPATAAGPSLAAAAARGEQRPRPYSERDYQ
jgi:TPR repeat protein